MPVANLKRKFTYGLIGVKQERQDQPGNVKWHRRNAGKGRHGKMAKRNTLGSASLAVLALTALPAYAQTPAGAEPPAAATTTAANDAGFADIVVTARKRAESLQSVPIAITAIGAAELEARQITDVKGLETVTPNLIINPNTLSAAGANIYIRGIGVGDFDRTFNPAVQILVDGVTFGSSISGQLLNIVDVDRIEVLRGPQGTLFGSNAIAGVVSITRPAPSNEFGGSAQVTIGNYGEVDGKGSLTGPLIPDKLQARISVAHLGNHGQFINDFNGRRRGFVDLWAVSPSLRFTPSENAEFILRYDYTRNRGDWGVLFNRSNSNDLICLAILLSATPRCENPNQDLRHVNQDTPTYLRIDNHALSLTANLTFGEVKVTSISAFSHTSEDKQTDFDAVPIPVFASAQPVRETMYSQELRAAWDVNDRLSLLVGGYGSYDDYTDGANSLFIFSLLGFPPNTTEVVFKHQKTYSLGVFLSGNYKFTDTLRLSVGGRYTYEHKDFEYRNGFNTVGGGYYPDAPGFNNVATGQQGWGQFTPRVGLEYTPQRDVLIYGSWAQGFKSGGFNGRGNSNDTIGPYRPEKVNTFELGLKSEWLDRRVRFNLTGFYTKYDDKQEEIIRTNPDTGATITIVDNASSVRYYGLEGEAAVKPFAGFTLSGTGSYLNSKYSRFIFAGFDVSDSVKLRNAPKFQFSVTGQYEFEIGSVKVESLLSYHWTDKYNTQLGPRYDGGGPSPLINDPRSLVRSYGLLDGSIGATFKLAGLDLKASVYGKNLTNERFYDVFLPVANLFNLSSVSLGRTYGVKLGVKF